MRLVIGCPVKDRAWILPNWFQAIEDQDIEHTVVCVYTPSEDDTFEILKDHNAVVLWDEQLGRSVTEIEGHHWGTWSKYEYMANMRNTLRRYAEDSDADYFFSLDSDILLPPGGLQKIINYATFHPGVVSPAVNMQPGGTAWNRMHFTDPYHPRMAERRPGLPQEGQVDVVMAAMFMDRLGMQVPWTAHNQGEDIGFSINAAILQIPLWWLPTVRCDHVMRRY